MPARDPSTGRFVSGGAGRFVSGGGGGGTEVERLIVRLVGDGSSYSRMLATAQRTTRTAMANVGKSLRTFSRNVSLYVLTPLALIGGTAVSAFGTFDKAMAESISIMDTTIEQTERMEAAALALSTRAVQGPEQLARSYFYLASAGKDAEQSMALLPQVASFATAGAFDMAQATDLLTDAQSALGLSTENVAQDTRNLARVSDVLVKANTLANASVEQFSIALTSKAGAALKAYNKDIEEGVAVLAAYADQGIKAQLAGNMFGRVMRLLTKTALENAEAHKDLNFRVFDATGTMRNFADIIGNLERITEGMSDKMKAATLDTLGFQARVQQAILPLLGTSEAIREYQKELDQAGGTTGEVAEKQMKAFSNQMKVMWNRVKVLSVEIGEALVPVVKNLMELLEAVITPATEWAKNSKALIGSMGELTVTFAGLTAAAWALGGALTVIANHPIIMAISAAIVAWKYYQSTLTSVKDHIQAIIDVTDEAYSRDLDRIRQLGTFSETQRLSNEEMARAESLIETLTSRYGDFGLEVDWAAGKLRGFAEAQREIERAALVRKMQEAKRAREEATRALQKETEEQQKVMEAAWYKKGSVGMVMRYFGIAPSPVPKEVIEAFDEAKKNAEDAQLALKEFDEQTEKIAKGEEIQKASRIIEGMIPSEKEADEAVNRFTDTAKRGITEFQEWMAQQSREAFRITEQYMTPEETYEKRMKQLRRLRTMGALGLEAGISRETFERAAKDAYQVMKKELEQAEGFSIKVDTVDLSGAMTKGSDEYYRALEAQRELFAPRPGAPSEPPTPTVGAQISPPGSLQEGGEMLGQALGQAIQHGTSMRSEGVKKVVGLLTRLVNAAEDRETLPVNSSDLKG